MVGVSPGLGWGAEGERDGAGRSCGLRPGRLLSAVTHRLPTSASR